MKPKTALQRQVVSLSKKLPKITERRIQWAYNTLFKFYMYQTKKVSVCFECGHDWPTAFDPQSIVNKLTEHICPNCKRLLERNETRGWRRMDVDHFHIITTYKNFQIIRGYHVKRYCHKGKKAEYFCSEVYQHWISEKGRDTILACDRNSFGQFSYTPWILHSGMSVKNDNDCYYQNGPKYPVKRIQPKIIRNGFDGRLHNYSPSYFFKLILGDSIFETLVKRNEEGLISDYSRYKDKINELWPLIKICFRNKYIIKDFGIWKDYIELLTYFERDIYSPKYICPEVLGYEHDRLVKKKRDIIRKQDIEKKKVQMKKDNAIYRKRLAKFFGIKFVDGELEVVVLNSVYEVLKEGDELFHCVFTNGYHNNKNSLLMSARIGNQRLETIDISLSNMQIVQSRGYKNGDSEYHDKIVQLVKKNINQLKKVK